MVSQVSVEIIDNSSSYLLILEIKLHKSDKNKNISHMIIEFHNNFIIFCESPLPAATFARRLLET